MRERVHEKTMGFIGSARVPLFAKREMLLILMRLAILRPLFMATDPDASLSALMIEGLLERLWHAIDGGLDE